VSDSKATKKKEFRISPSSGWAGAWRKAAFVAAGGAAFTAYGFFNDPKRAAFSYLFAFFFFLTLAFGATFFVLIEYLTRSGWGVVVRRTAEFFMGGMPVFLVLVIPVLFSMPRLFPWIETQDQAEVTEAGGGEHAEGAPASAKLPPIADIEEKNIEPAAMAHAYDHDLVQLQEKYEQAEKKTVIGKHAYINKRFFMARAVFYVFVWVILALTFFRLSTGQDSTKSVENTARAQRYAPVAMIVFGVTLTFAAFDWLMSLDPNWFSTIFGVTIFAGSTVAHMSCLILLTLALRRSGLLDGAINVEHYHDLGKLLFGWLVFWAYVSFAQFFLIWYSNIPEELIYFHRRWDDNGGTWKSVSFFIMIVHFAIPFWFLMSRNIKRRIPLLALGAATLLVAQVVEMYWIVLPNYGVLEVHWLDAACFLFVGGAYFTWVLKLMEGNALIPVGDPRLSRSLAFENA
jgi:hypothetical protein